MILIPCGWLQDIKKKKSKKSKKSSLSSAGSDEGEGSENSGLNKLLEEEVGGVLMLALEKKLNSSKYRIGVINTSKTSGLDYHACNIYIHQ